MSRLSGKTIGGVEHLRQSITDILTTRKGTRRMRPEYGSNIPSFVDAPANAGLASAMQADIANALARWEPRISITSVQVTAITEGTISIVINGTYLGNSLILPITI